MIQNGMAPRKIIPNVTDESGTAALTVNINNPKGGVRSPASITKIPKIAKANGSMPIDAAIGAKIGTVSRMIDVESMNIPRINQIENNIIIMMTGLSLIDRIVPLIIETAPPIARKREYIDAVINKIMIGAVVLPAR